MKDFGQINYFLGIEFQFSNGSVKMHQAKFAEKILAKFGMSECKTKLVPCDVNIPKIDLSDSEHLTDRDKRVYQECVGSLIYLTTASRPDISFVVNKLSQHMSKPTQADMNLAKSVLRYVKGTIDKGIVYTKVDEALQLVIYSDSDWGSMDDRKSITGYCCKLSPNSALVSWCSKKQQTVALSSCESEFMALSASVQEAIFLKQLLTPLVGENISPILIYADNKGSISLARNPVYHKRSKHIDIRFFFLREHINSGLIVIQYIQSNENMADLFTHAVPRAKLLKFDLVK